jgi:phosphatidylglycerophosphate synthase
LTVSTQQPTVELSVDGPVVGLLAQLVLFGVLASTVGLGVAGWTTGVLFAGVTFVLLSRAVRRTGLRSFGVANQVTLGRATLVGGVAALVADSFQRDVPVAVLVILATVALVLDGVDGYVARRTGTATPLGARFDMEIDAALILILSALVADTVGVWALAIGLMRYAFVAAARVAPWLNAALPPRFARKVVAALQGVLLVVAASGLLPAFGTLAVVGLALASLCWSFGTDVGWLWRAHRAPRDAEPRILARV